MGHLWKRGKVWYMGYQDRRGNWKQASCRTTDKQAAKDKLKEKERLVASGENKPLAEFLQDYLKSRSAGLGPRWLQRYERCKDLLTDANSPLGGLSLQEIDVAACSRYIAWRLGHQRKNGTILKEVSWLKAAMDAAAEDGHVSWERAYQLRRKKWPEFRGANTPRERVLYPHEKEILFDAARDNSNLSHALTLAFWTGLRRQNILELVEGQADFTCEPSVIRFTPAQMKNRSGHTVLLAPEARAVLWGLWQGVPSRRFFADFRPAWKRLQAKLEQDGTLVDFRFHDLRRTYTTYRIAAGVDPKTAQDEVAHKSSKMTMDVYAKALKDPAIRAWAQQHFRFPWDPGVTYMQDGAAKNGEMRGGRQLDGQPDKALNL